MFHLIIVGLIIVKYHTLQQLKACFAKQYTGLLNFVVQIIVLLLLWTHCALATCTNNTWCQPILAPAVLTT